MTPCETKNLANAIIQLATVSYPTNEDHNYPTDDIAFEMGQIAGHAARVINHCYVLETKEKPDHV
jgi:hypothetical protein